MDRETNIELNMCIIRTIDILEEFDTNGCLRELEFKDEKGKKYTIVYVNGYHVGDLEKGLLMEYLSEKEMI